MAIPRGKGVWLWKIWEQEGGSIEAPNLDGIVETLVAAGASHVVIKVADGTYPYNVRWGNYPWWSGGILADLAAELVPRLQQALIQVIGYQYVRGFRPLDEAAALVKRVTELGLDGVSIDAEHEYRRTDFDDEAAAYVQALREGVGGDIPISLASFRFPSLHRDLPYEQFLAACDHNAPQVYWQGAHNPVAQLDRCIREYGQIYAGAGLEPLPMTPIGSGYGEHGWVALPADITAFLQGCMDREILSASLWSYDYMRGRGPDLWAAFADFEWPDGDEPDEEPAPPDSGVPERLVAVAGSLLDISQGASDAAQALMDLAQEFEGD